MEISETLFEYQFKVAIIRNVKYVFSSKYTFTAGPEANSNPKLICRPMGEDVVARSLDLKMKIIQQDVPTQRMYSK